MNKNSLNFVSTVALTSLLGATAAQAQSVDYGAAEQMFGEPVTASATGTPQRVTDVPVDMTIVTAEQIKRSGVTDIPTILSRVAGIDILNWSAQSSDVSVRGYDQVYSPRLLVLINGRQVYLDYYGYTAWSTLPVQLSEIRQIEVVRGPNSALFGFNAVGGVINIITYNPKFDDVTALSVHTGNNGLYSGSAVGTVHLGDSVSIRASLGATRQEEWKKGTKTADALSTLAQPWRYSASLDGVAQLADDTELRLEGTWSRASQTDVMPNYSLYAFSYRVWSAKAAVTSDTEFGQIQAQAYINKVDATAPVLAVHFANPVVVASVQDLFKLGTDQIFRLGLEYRDNSMKTTPVADGTISYAVWAPSAMWNWTASPQLALTVSGRLDHLILNRTGTFPTGQPNADNALWDRTLTEVSINAGAVYQPTTDDTFRLTYARGVQIPTLLDDGGLLGGPGGGPANSNPLLKPSIVSNYQLSYDRDLTPLGAKAGVKLFTQTTQNVMVGFASLNAGNSRMTGVEVSASGKFAEGWRWSADWTYTHVENHVPAGLNAIALQIDFAASSPKHRGNVNLGWSDERWDVDAFLHYVSKIAISNCISETPIDAYATLAARIGYRLDDGWTIALSGQNLAQNYQTQSNGYRAPRQVMFSIDKAF